MQAEVFTGVDDMAKSITFEQLYDKLGKQPCKNMHETVKLNISVKQLKNLLFQLEESNKSVQENTEICVFLILQFSKSEKPYFSVVE